MMNPKDWSVKETCLDDRLVWDEQLQSKKKGINHGRWDCRFSLNSVDQKVATSMIAVGCGCSLNETPPAICTVYALLHWRAGWNTSSNLFHTMHVATQSTTCYFWLSLRSHIREWLALLSICHWKFTIDMYIFIWLYIYVYIYEWRTKLFVHHNCHEQNWVVPYRLWICSLFENIQ